MPDPMIFAAMGELARVGGTAIVHAENQGPDRRARLATRAEGHAGRRWEARAHHAAFEGEAVHRALAMARVAACRCSCTT